MSRRNLLWLIPLLLFMTFPLWRIPVAAFLAPRGGYDPALAGRKLDSHNFSMENVHLTESDQGQTTLQIDAKRASTGKDSSEIVMEEVDAVLSGLESDKKTFITSRKALLDREASHLTLIDDVVVMRPMDSFELYTDLLFYDGRSHIARSPGKTLIIGKDIEIRGTTLIYNTLNESYDLGGRVRCTLGNFAPDKSSIR